MTIAWILLALVSAVNLYLLKQLIRLRAQVKKGNTSDEKYSELESKIESLELRSLHQTLNPHLCKNTLNAIQSHAYQTYYTLDKLAGVLDYILYESKGKFVTVKEEVEFALNLIEINKLKVSPLFDLRIKQLIDLNDMDSAKMKLAPMVSVDLIENAFKHADLQRENAFISVTFELEDDQFSMTVSNTTSVKSPMRKPKSGLGRENFRKRLEILYRRDFTLNQYVKEDIYIAQLKIDLREHNPQMLTAR